MLPKVEAAAHAPGQSYVYFRIFEQAVEVRIEIAVRDVNRVLRLDLPASRSVSLEELEANLAPHLDSIRAYVESRLHIKAAGQPVGLRFREQDLLKAGRPGIFVRLHYDVIGLNDVPPLFDVTYTALFDADPDHRNMVLVEHNWRTGTFNNEGNVAFILSPEAPQGSLDLSSSSLWRGFVAMIRFGITHILVGLDHIFFLLALILPAVLFREENRWMAAPRFRGAFLKIVAIVTFFTLAHSITLSLAALQVVRLPSVLVESVIAASIAVAALHNLNPSFLRYESIIAFVFGLFHGFGFASLLAPLGLGREHTALTLLGFNLGVEVGQVLVIALIFPVLFLLRVRPWYTRAVLQYGSVVLIAVAVYWCVERVFYPSLTDYAVAHAKEFVRPFYQAILAR